MQRRDISFRRRRMTGLVILARSNQHHFRITAHKSSWRNCRSRGRRIRGSAGSSGHRRACRRRCEGRAKRRSRNGRMRRRVSRRNRDYGRTGACRCQRWDRCRCAGRRICGNSRYDNYYGRRRRLWRRKETPNVITGNTHKCHDCNYRHNCQQSPE